jgi:hypothetical protein
MAGKMKFSDIKPCIGRAFQRGDMHSELIRRQELEDLVRREPLLVREFVLSTLANEDLSLHDIEEAAIIADVFRQCLDDASLWGNVWRRATAKGMGLFAAEVMACISVAGESEYWVEAPERIAAREYWLAVDRDSAWCDHCEKRKPLRRGAGFMVKGQKMVLVGNTPGGSQIVDMGPELICAECFAERGGVRRRPAGLAERTSLPGRPSPQDSGFLHRPPPEQSVSDLLQHVRTGKWTLEQVSDWVKGQKTAASQQPPLRRKLLTRLAMWLRTRFRPRHITLPRYWDAWLEYEQQLQHAAERLDSPPPGAPAPAFLESRALLIVSKLIDSPVLKQDTLVRLWKVFTGAKLCFESAEVLTDLVAASRSRGLSRKSRLQRQVTREEGGLLENQEDDLLTKYRRLHVSFLQSLVNVLCDDYRFDEALEWSYELFARSGQANLRDTQSWARTKRGKIYVALGNNDRARDCFFHEGGSVIL